MRVHDAGCMDYFEDSINSVVVPHVTPTALAVEVSVSHGCTIVFYAVSFIQPVVSTL